MTVKVQLHDNVGGIPSTGEIAEECRAGSMCMQKRWKKLRGPRFSNKLMGAIKESAMEGDSSATGDEVCTVSAPAFLRFLASTIQCPISSFEACKLCIFLF